jgi:putative transposase
MARIKKLAAWLDQKYPSAASSLVEGLEECFTINRLDVPPSLCRCLATTNIIESPHAGVRIQTRRVTHWQDGNMVLRWMTSAFLRTEKRFNKIMGYRDLCAPVQNSRSSTDCPDRAQWSAADLAVFPSDLPSLC